MRFTIAQGTLLAIAGLAKAQTCPSTIIGFEDLDVNIVAQFGVVNPLQPPSPIPQGYSGLNWTNFFGVAPSPAAQFLLPQRKIFAVAPNSPATNPPSINANTGKSFDPHSVFMGTFAENGVAGAASLASASTITVTGFFANGTNAQATFKFDPPSAVFGLAVSAIALQNFQFPCGWKNVIGLTFKPQSENGVDPLLGLAIDNLMLAIN